MEGLLSTAIMKLIESGLGWIVAVILGMAYYFENKAHKKCLELSREDGMKMAEILKEATQVNRESDATNKQFNGAVRDQAAAFKAVERQMELQGTLAESRATAIRDEIIRLRRDQ